MTELGQELSNHPFLYGLAPAHVQALAACSRRGSYPAGGFILREGGTAETLYLLTAGRVVLEVGVPGRGPLRVETLESGDILGLHWLFPPHRWVLDARAVEPVFTLELDAACVRRLMAEDFGLGYALAMRLLRQLYDRLERVRLQRLDVYAKQSSR